MFIYGEKVMIMAGERSGYFATIEKCDGEFADVKCQGQKLTYHIKALKREKECLFDESDLGGGAC